MDSSGPWAILARILRPQGRKGEVLADLFTDFPQRFSQRSRVWLAQAGFAEGAQPIPAHIQPEPIQIASYWLPVGRNSGRIVLHFAGVDSISAADALSGKEVVVPISERLPLEDGSIYISDLVGCRVYDRDAELGIVEAVQFPASPDGARRMEEAAPLLVLRDFAGEELLLPFASSYLLHMDTAAKIIRMALPEGLAELNRAQSGE